MRAGLQDAGIDSDFCHDGETGLELLLHNCYDACCLDRMLPSMDGLTILKKARAAKVSAPVLMLTAMGGLDDKVDGLEAGADDYLAKPFAMRELVARLHALLRRPSQAMAVEESNQIHYEDAVISWNYVGQKDTVNYQKRKRTSWKCFSDTRISCLQESDCFPGFGAMTLRLKKVI